MQQLKFTGDGVGDVRDWILAHNRDYGKVRARLTAVRNVVLNGRLDCAADILQKSYVFAVLSIQTDRDRHENAFIAHCSGDIDLKDASLQTVYGGQKYGWIDTTFQSTDWETVAIAVRAHARAGRHGDLLQAIVDNLKGVSYRKGAFMLAMAGMWEYMCIDTNVAQYAYDDFDGRLTFDSSAEYMAACHDIHNTIAIDIPPFIIQWAIYDYQRGEHSRHMAFFREVIDW